MQVLSKGYDLICTAALDVFAFSPPKITLFWKSSKQRQGTRRLSVSRAHPRFSWAGVSIFDSNNNKDDDDGGGGGGGRVMCVGSAA